MIWLLDFRALAVSLLLFSIACDGGGKTPLSDVAKEGRTVYMSVCIACHNYDPNLDGGLGPANAGASLALLEAKILRGEYPPGYTPKRASRAMPPLPHLAEQIPALHAFLTESQRDLPKLR